MDKNVILVIIVALFVLLFICPLAIEPYADKSQVEMDQDYSLEVQGCTNYPVIGWICP